MVHALQVTEADNRIIQISRILKFLRLLVNDWIKDKNMNIQFEQLPVLLCIYTKGVVCQQEIAATLMRDKSSVLRSVRLLHQKGLIVMSADEVDGRKKQLLLTEAGALLALRFIDFIPEFDLAWSSMNNKQNTELQFATSLYF